MDGGVAIAVVVIGKGELGSHFDVIGGDVHVTPGLVLRDNINIEAKAGEGRVAFTGGQLAEDFIVGPILLCDVDNIPDGAFADALERWQWVAAVVGDLRLHKSMVDRVLRLEEQLAWVRDADLLECTQLNIPDIGTLGWRNEPVSTVWARPIPTTGDYI